MPKFPMLPETSAAPDKKPEKKESRGSAADKAAATASGDDAERDEISAASKSAHSGKAAASQAAHSSESAAGQSALPRFAAGQAILPNQGQSAPGNVNAAKAAPKAAIFAAAPAAQQDCWADLFTGRHLAIILVMAGGVLLYAMNLYFTAALMPSIIADIGGERYYAWVTTAFVTAAIIASMFVSRLLTAKGAAFAYAAAFIIFALGAAANALSSSIAPLLIGRAVQGLGGGLLAGLGFATIRTALPRRHWGRATGVASAMWGLGALFGPALGGVFAALGLWRWSYGLIAAISLPAAYFARHAFRRVQHDEPHRPVPLASLAPLILAAIAISLSSIAPMGWPLAALLAAGLALLWLFALAERRGAETILPRLTYQRGNALKWIYLAVAGLSAGGMIENFIPLFGQKLAGLNPLTAGFLGAVLSLAWVITQILVVAARRQKDRRRAICLGPILLTAGLLAYSLLQTANVGAAQAAGWAAALALAGIGAGLAYPLLNVAAMSSSQDSEEGGKAATAITIIELITFSITSALAGTLMAAGGDSTLAAARYVSFGIAALTVPGIFAAWIAVRE